MKFILWFCAFVFCVCVPLLGDIFAAAAVTLLVFGLGMGVRAALNALRRAGAI